jgi:hypothetical protein
MSRQGTTEGRMSEAVLTRSGRTSKPTTRWIEAMVTRTLGNARNDASQVEGELMCQSSMFPDE